MPNGDIKFTLNLIYFQGEPRFLPTWKRYWYCTLVLESLEAREDSEHRFDVAEYFMGYVLGSHGVATAAYEPNIGRSGADYGIVLIAC